MASRACGLKSVPHKMGFIAALLQRQPGRRRGVDGIYRSGADARSQAPRGSVCLNGIPRHVVSHA
jgi:hypothetical protein